MCLHLYSPGSYFIYLNIILGGNLSYSCQKMQAENVVRDRSHEETVTDLKNQTLGISS